MKETYSVEIKQNDYNDDLFNGTLAECIDYIRECDYTVLDNDARIARILIDNDNTVVECLEIIPYAEFTDNTTLITSAIHDMRSAFNNLCDIISAANGIDNYNAKMLAELVSNIDDYSKSFDYGVI